MTVYPPITCSMVLAKAASCLLTVTMTATPCAPLWPHAAHGPASSQCRTVSTSRLSARSSTDTVISSNDSSINSNISAPSQPAMISATTTSSPQSNSLQSGYRSEEHTSELQSLMRISYAVFCLKKKKTHTN